MVQLFHRQPCLDLDRVAAGNVVDVEGMDTAELNGLPQQGVQYKEDVFFVPETRECARGQPVGSEALITAGGLVGVSGSHGIHHGLFGFVAFLNGLDGHLRLLRQRVIRALRICKAPDFFTVGNFPEEDRFLAESVQEKLQGVDEDFPGAEEGNEIVMLRHILLVSGVDF